MYQYQIQEFGGIQQQKDGTFLPVNSASDCRNVSTLDGNLTVAKGYEKHIATIIPGDDRILKLIVARGAADKFFVVTATRVYAYVGSAWEAIYTFPDALTSTQIDYLQTQISGQDYLIISTGCSQMVKVKLSDNTAAVFGTGTYSFDGTVSSYDSETKVITLSSALSAEALRHAPLDGITVNDVWLDVASATGATVTLKDVPETAPESGNAATIRGGGSNAHCNFVELYYGRMFSAGDPDAPCRLYWSAVAGDGRTYEDWLSVAGSADASGGYVEVGDASGDAITGFVVLATEMLIFKRYSVYRLYGDRPSTYAIERVENFSEQMSNASAVVKYNVPYYLTRSGIKYYDGTGILPMSGGVRFIDDFIKTVQDVSISKGVHCDNVLYFTCRVDDGSAYDDSIIVYDIAREAFTLRDGFQISDIVQHNGKLYLVNGNRYVYEFNRGTSYDGEPINAYWQTQKTDLSKKMYKKQITNVLFRASSGSIVVTVNTDRNSFSQQRNLMSDDDGLVDISVKIDKTRSFSIRIENEAGSYFSIEGGLEALFMNEASR